MNWENMFMECYKSKNGHAIFGDISEILENDKISIFLWTVKNINIFQVSTCMWHMKNNLLSYGIILRKRL